MEATLSRDDLYPNFIDTRVAYGHSYSVPAKSQVEWAEFG